MPRVLPSHGLLKSPGASARSSPPLSVVDPNSIMFTGELADLVYRTG